MEDSSFRKNMPVDGKVIVFKYDKLFTVRVIDPVTGSRTRITYYDDYGKRMVQNEPQIREVQVKVKKIIIDDEFTYFFDYYSDLSGAFKNDLLIGYAESNN